MVLAVAFVQPDVIRERFRRWRSGHHHHLQSRLASRREEDQLGWVKDIAPDLEAALSPKERAVLKALRRYRRDIRGPS